MSASPLSTRTRDALRAAGLAPGEVHNWAQAALAEDLRYGPDVTTQATVPPGAIAEARITPRRPGVLAGAPVALAVFDLAFAAAPAAPAAPGATPGGYQVLSATGDGAALAAGRPALVLRGPVRGLLTAERTALNFLCHLSGIATVTARWVRAVAGTGAVVRDSRKTLPGLRVLEKYAVRCGGGRNHRMGLGDSVLIKDNHIEAAGSVTAALAAVAAHSPGLHCEVEVDDLDQLAEAVAAGAAEVLLDNFTADQCARAVRLARAAGTGVRLEASGGLTLENAPAYAAAGVDYLAVGALTHSAPYLDLGLDLTAGEGVLPVAAPAQEDEADDQDRHQPADAGPEAFGAAEQMAGHDRCHGDGDDHPHHRQAAGPLHAAVTQRQGRVGRGAHRGRDGCRPPRQVGEQSGQVTPGAGAQGPPRPVIELVLGEPPGLEVIAQLGDRLVALGV